MRLTLVRNATVLVEIGGTRFLVDPMLDEVGARPPIESTANPVPNPTVPLPFPAKDWEGIRIARTPGRHGTGRIAELLAPVSGFLLDDLYLAGDTVWYEGVEETIARHRPRVAVVNASGAEFLEGGLIGMGIDDVREVAAYVPTVVAVHLEALNHCFLTRAELRAALPAVLVPEDGEALEL